MCVFKYIYKYVSLCSYFRLRECENSDYSCCCMVNYSNNISNEFLEKKSVL